MDLNSLNTSLLLAVLGIPLNTKPLALLATAAVAYPLEVTSSPLVTLAE
jgi:hypothetical protein